MSVEVQTGTQAHSPVSSLPPSLSSGEPGLPPTPAHTDRNIFKHRQMEGRQMDRQTHRHTLYQTMPAHSGINTFKHGWTNRPYTLIETFKSSRSSQQVQRNMFWDSKCSPDVPSNSKLLEVYACLMDMTTFLLGAIPDLNEPFQISKDNKCNGSMFQI